MRRCLIIAAAALVGVANAQLVTKLVGTGGVGNAVQGTSVALSADGNTAVVGGQSDNDDAGAAWVYARSGSVWTQQGGKLVGTGAVGSAGQGTSVSLSADGNTAIVGGYEDNGTVGAAWVYTRSGSVWTQQGSKLVGTGTVGRAGQGTSVSLSADGNTAIVGGRGDNNFAGAAWAYTRSGGLWTQQGSKLVGTAAVGNAMQGSSVALSADGNTAIVGGPDDSVYTGAAWVYMRSGSAWTQQGGKLVGSILRAEQGESVALSADGSTALVGGWAANGGSGAASVYTRSGGRWTQQGSDLEGTGSFGNAQRGSAVSLSADGNTAIVTEPGDTNNTGAAWVFARSGGLWTQQGSKLVGTGAVGNAQQGYSVSLSADGNTALVGGPDDNGGTGAAWAYVDVTHSKSAGPLFTSNGIVNAASFQYHAASIQNGPNGGGIAPGEIITIFGTGIGPSQVANGYDRVHNVFANSVAETQVLFDGVAAPILYASSGQTSVVVPYSLALRSSTRVIISYQGVQSAPVTVPLVSFAPGIFTLLANGTGQAAAENQDYSLNSSLHPEKRGNLVQVFMTVGGEHGVDGSMATGAVFDNPLPTATIGGKNAQVIYAGPSPGLPWGLTQVNLYIPSTLTLSGPLPLTITYDGVTSQTNVTIAVGQ